MSDAHEPPKRGHGTDGEWERTLASKMGVNSSFVNTWGREHTHKQHTVKGTSGMDVRPTQTAHAYLLRIFLVLQQLLQRRLRVQNERLHRRQLGSVHLRDGQLLRQAVEFLDLLLEFLFVVVRRTQSVLSPGSASKQKGGGSCRYHRQVRGPHLWVAGVWCGRQWAGGWGIPTLR